MKPKGMFSPCRILFLFFLPPETALRNPPASLKNNCVRLLVSVVEMCPTPPPPSTPLFPLQLTGLDSSYTEFLPTSLRGPGDKEHIAFPV